MAHILIAEDDNRIAMLEKDYLEIDGFQVTIASDGNEALKLILAEDFDLLLLDIMLPGKDGYDICREVRDKIDIPILMVTAKPVSYTHLMSEPSCLHPITTIPLTVFMKSCPTSNTMAGRSPSP